MLSSQQLSFFSFSYTAKQADNLRNPILHPNGQCAVFPQTPMGSTFSLPQMLFSISRYFFSPSFKGLLCEMSPATLSLISVFPSLYP